MANRSILLAKEKLVLSNGLVREVVVWKVPETDKYPDGVRYRMALVVPSSGQVLVLFDNHFPKGHHKHLKGNESSYEYHSVGQLVEDFLTGCKNEEEKV